jgi:hypothetical protein
LISFDSLFYFTLSLLCFTLLQLSVDRVLIKKLFFKVVENVEIRPSLGQLQHPAIKKIVNSPQDILYLASVDNSAQLSAVSKSGNQPSAVTSKSRSRPPAITPCQNDSMLATSSRQKNSSLSSVVTDHKQNMKMATSLSKQSVADNATAAGKKRKASPETGRPFNCLIHKIYWPFATRMDIIFSFLLQLQFSWGTATNVETSSTIFPVTIAAPQWHRSVLRLLITPQISKRWRRWREPENPPENRCLP